MTALDDVVVTADELARRVIEPDRFVADTQAFIDVRLPRSAGKASYSFVGPGVSQNAGQTVNLDLPHGFCVGAASMPHGVVNNPHMHYTAEVFICTGGRWRMAIGRHGEQTLDIDEGTIFSTPTWVFRGFENIGPDDGFLFTVLGGDDPGGILWAPEVLAAAATTGLYLDADLRVVESTDGPVPGAVVPADEDELALLDRYEDDELAARAVPYPSLRWSDRALLASVLPGHASEIAPVIGLGLTEDRRHRSPITTAHGFSIEWLRLPPGGRTGCHRHGDSQVLLLRRGDWEIVGNRGEQANAVRPAPGAVVSVPAGAWRDLVNVGDTPAEAVVVCGGDGRTRLEWAPETATAAAAAGWALDANGYVAPARLLGGAAR